MHERIARGTIAALAVLATAACGGGGDDPGAQTAPATPTPPPQEQPAEPGQDPAATPTGTPTPEPPLERSELARRLDAACRASIRRATRARARLGPDATAQEQAENVALLDRSTDRALATIQRLQVPREQGEAFGDFLSAARAARALSRDLAAALATGEEEAIRPVRREIDRLEDRRRAAARKLGSELCASAEAL